MYSYRYCRGCLQHDRPDDKWEDRSENTSVIERNRWWIQIFRSWELEIQRIGRLAGIQNGIRENLWYQRCCLRSSCQAACAVIWSWQKIPAIWIWHIRMRHREESFSLGQIRWGEIFFPWSGMGDGSHFWSECLQRLSLRYLQLSLVQSADVRRSGWIRCSCVLQRFS